MIGTLFRLGADYIMIKVDGHNVRFSSTMFGTVDASIDGLKLNYRGVIKEFPDLEGVDDWKDEAITRFKEKIIDLKTEDERMSYIIEDLKQHGYRAIQTQKSGFRTVKQ